MPFNFAGQYHGGRPKYEVTTGSKASYTKFMQSNPGAQLTFKQYYQCIVELNRYYLKYILETGKKVILPHGMGKMMIQRSPDNRGIAYRRGCGINWKETMVQGTLVPWTNHHTDGSRFKYKWIRTTSKIRCKAIWRLTMSKENKRLLNKYIMDEDNDYKDRYAILPKPNKSRVYDKRKSNKVYKP